MPFSHVTNEKIVYYFHKKPLKIDYYTLQIQKPFSRLLTRHKRFFLLLTSGNFLQCNEVENDKQYPMFPFHKITAPRF